MTMPLLQTAAITTAGAGDLVVITGVTPGRIKVWRLVLVTAGATNVTLKDGSTALTGAIPTVAGVPVNFEDGSSDQPQFILGAGNNFTINNSAAVQMSGCVWYTIASVS